jgi:hypothetical protein
VKRMVLITALLGALAVPGVAQADWFYSKRGAERVARDAVSKRYSAYGFTAGDTVASCRPQARSYDPRYKYHRWVCGWGGEAPDGDVCGGTLLITGSRGTGNYYHRVLRGGRC